MGLSPVANAQTAPDMSQMSDTLKKLEARVSALEAENQQSKKEAAAARAEARELRQRIGAKSFVVGPVTATSSIALAAAPSGKLYEVKSPMQPVRPDWAGLYVGAAGGAGWLHGSEALSESSNSISSSAFTGGSDVTTSTSGESANLTGGNPGAMASLFVGYNYMLSSNWLIGTQLEGTLANTRVHLNGSGSTTSVSTTVNTPPGGVAGTNTSTTTGTLSGISDPLDNRWLLSVLARAGFLVDGSDLVYVLGGYTYGRFEAEGNGFGMNGGTIGVGWEKQIIGGWNLRGEYRYTRFGSETVNLAQATTSAGVTTGSFTGGNNLASTINETSRFSDLDMHSVWLGVSYSFKP
jgi:opacity protein-like surface antigen